MAVEVAEAICAQPALEAAALTTWLDNHARAHWAGQSFFRLLNRMLFKGAEPEQRVKIFRSFYGHGEALIGRFYAGRLTAFDKLRVLARGAPTVPGPRAWRAAMDR
jgi:lycopene beta-cyclase